MDIVLIVKHDHMFSLKKNKNITFIKLDKKKLTFKFDLMLKVLFSKIIISLLLSFFDCYYDNVYYSY